VGVAGLLLPTTAEGYTMAGGAEEVSPAPGTAADRASPAGRCAVAGGTAAIPFPLSKPDVFSKRRSKSVSGVASRSLALVFICFWTIQHTAC
jgi:hypothetical protein